MRLLTGTPRVLRFLLNETLIEESDLPPDLTVLDYLRDRRSLYGTKEGCASGDCGACTVVVASVESEQLNYRSINSCIAFVGTLHGCQLITVEHLASHNTLHPAQQVMVDSHGSQCGFCTPGFVMSIFALTKNPADTQSDQTPRELIDEYLGGNLCRCTGYRPIVDAAKSAIELSCAADACDKFSDSEKDTVSVLKSLVSGQNTRHGEFFRPHTIKAACKLRVEYPQAAILAGGTDLALSVTQQLGRQPQILSLQDIAELDYCTAVDGHWCIGAGYALAAFQRKFGAQCADIDGLLRRFGSTQIRNRGTVGGNIANASPIGDLPPLLIALDAQLVLQSSTSQRVLDVEDYFVDYKKTALRVDELLVEIRLPRKSLVAAEGMNKPKLKIYKISKRTDDDISAVLAVFSFTIADGKVQSIRAAFGGMAAVPKRAYALEEVLTGKPLTPETLELADAALESEFQPISDARASDWYRLQVCKNLLRRLAVEVTEPQTGTRVVDYVG